MFLQKAATGSSPVRGRVCLQKPLPEMDAAKLFAALKAQPPPCGRSGAKRIFSFLRRVPICPWEIFPIGRKRPPKSKKERLSFLTQRT